MEKQSKTITEEIQGTVDEIIKQIQKIVKEGNARRVLIKNKNGKVLFQSQLTIGAAGITFFAIYAPLITAITTLVLMANDVSVIIEKDAETDETHDEYEVDAEVIEIKDEDEVNDDEEEEEK